VGACLIALYSGGVAKKVAQRYQRRGEASQAKRRGVVTPISQPSTVP
jgi:hypothetical protein